MHKSVGGASWVCTSCAIIVQCRINFIHMWFWCAIRHHNSLMSHHFILSTSFMKRKFKQWWLSNPLISTKSFIVTELTEHKQYNDIWRWKSSSWLRTGTKMWLTQNTVHMQVFDSLTNCSLQFCLRNRNETHSHVDVQSQSIPFLYSVVVTVSCFYFGSSERHCIQIVFPVV